MSFATCPKIPRGNGQEGAARVCGQEILVALGVCRCENFPPAVSSCQGKRKTRFCLAYLDVPGRCTLLCAVNYVKLLSLLVGLVPGFILVRNVAYAESVRLQWIYCGLLYAGYSRKDTDSNRCRIS